MARLPASRDNAEKLNIELNLVPFIDLLSSLVMFLLVTAVWIQISVIPASVQGHDASSTPSSSEPENRTFIRLTSSAYELSWPTTVTNLPAKVEKKEGQYDVTGLVGLLALATKNSSATEAAVSAEEDVDYGAVVQAIDAAKAGGFKVVAISIVPHPTHAL
jgi:biopolymer transport protein TolR